MIDDRRRDVYAGLLMALLGAGTAVMGTRYEIGTLTSMGPGFFPLVLGVLMIGVGVLIAGTAKSGQTAPGASTQHGILAHDISGGPDWRGWGCIIGAVISFIVLAKFAGLLPAIFACVFIGCWGDRGATLRGSIALASGVSVFGIVLFWYFLQVQIPIIQGF